MKIVIYSSNSNIFDGNIFHYYNYPFHAEFWENFSEHNFVFICDLPGAFLLDLENNELIKKAKNVEYILEAPTVENIKKQNPDIVCSGTFWVTPFDWLPIKDAMIGEELKKEGIKTFCHSVETAQICFDKRKTHDFLKNNGFNYAKSVYVHHELYWAERNHSEIKTNFYKESVIYQIKQLKLPLIIKDTVGLSSYGMEVCQTYGQVIGFLNSKKNNGDKLVEEYIEGIQFGTEIHGSKDSGFKIFNPFLFSVNQYGITSPKQSIKLGPVTNEKYLINDLKDELLRLANLMDFSGVSQIDLVFDGCNWIIIEINPRLSGMTRTLITSKDKFLTFALKLPILTLEQIEELKKIKFIKQINQVVNDAAKQRRECGYCEIIFCDDNKEMLENDLEILKKKYPELIDEGFYKQAFEMLSEI